MPEFIQDKVWIKWYPNEIFLKKNKGHQKFLYYFDQFRQEDFYTDIEDKQECNIPNKLTNEVKIDIQKTEAYKIGFEKGLLQGKQESVLLKNKVNNLLLEFENAFSIFENVLYTRILKIVLIASSYVIGKKIVFDELILLDYIKNIIKKENVFLNKLQIVVHSQNKRLIEEILADILETYKWTVLYDDNIDINSFKINSENSYIDATVDARWQELCRLTYSEAR